MLTLVRSIIDAFPGFAWETDFESTTSPVHSRGSPSLLRPLFTHHDKTRCRNLRPACHRLRLSRPRLRTRLTLGRLTLPRNPEAFGVIGLRNDDATHSGILTSSNSTSPSGLASLSKNAPLPSLSLAKEGFTASVHGLSLATLSVPAHSTSELLRTLSMMAASKPTSWLLLRADSL